MGDSPDLGTGHGAALGASESLVAVSNRHVSSRRSLVAGEAWASEVAKECKAKNPQ